MSDFDLTQAGAANSTGKQTLSDATEREFYFKKQASFFVSIVIHTRNFM